MGQSRANIAVSSAELMHGEGLASALPGWNADLLQLGRGRLEACGIHMPLTECRLSLVQVGRKAVLRAITPRDQVSALFVPPSSPSLRIGMRPIMADHCLAAGPGAVLEIVVPDGASMLVLHLQPERRGAHHGHPWLPRAGHLELRTLPYKCVASVSECSRRLASLCRTSPACSIRSVQRDLDRLAASAIGALSSGATRTLVAADDGTLRRMAVTRACEHMESNLRKPLTLQDLCTAAGVGTRTLEYGFQEAYELGPMAYLRSLRLAHVRKNLAHPRSAAVSVTSVARRWCFTHMGQFSKDYRNQFGESPSETLKRSREGCNWGCVAQPA
jgi:AraC-like DNA-binding protein